MKYNTSIKKSPQEALPDRLKNKLSQALELQKRGEISAAQAIYKRIIDRDRRHFDALYLLGTSYIQMSDYAKAAYYLSKVIMLNPHSSIAHNNLGIALENSGDQEKAKHHFKTAVRLDSGNADGYTNLGNIYQQTDNLSTAIECYRSSINIAESAFAYLGLGNAYRKQNKPDNALSCYEKTLELSPDLIEARNAFGLMLKELGEFDKSIQIYQKALTLGGDKTLTLWNLGLLKLLMGDYREGWQGYEYGRLTIPPIRQTLINHKTEWTGEASLKNRSILVYSEQGIGDEIMFSSCISKLKRLTDRIHIICDGRLSDIFQRSFPSVKVHELSDLQSIESCINEHQIDYSIPSGSLPKYFINEISEFCGASQYLVADPEKISRWRQRYDAINNKPKIGISWVGGKNSFEKRQRSTQLSDWVELFHQLDATYINLQYGDYSAEINELNVTHGIRIRDWEDSDPLLDIDDFFAKVQALDYVITIDNSTVHAAGSLGVPTIAFLPEVADWRWLSHGNMSPWYPSLRLLRKSFGKSWSECISNAVNEIRSFIKISETVLVDRISQEAIISSNIETEIDFKESNTINIDILYENRDHSSLTATPIKCAIITPIGPGHWDILSQCKQSLTKAVAVCTGDFLHIEHICIDDRLGNLGRSHARNIAVRTAYERGVDWVFFIDADDLMAPNAFEVASLLTAQYDAIWGRICSFDHATNQIDERAGQLGETTHLHDIVFNDPYLTLQMGHFVRTEIALANPFNESMDAGEDFDYYLKLWNKYRCIRTNALLFINRRGLHSTGPKSATGADWRVTVGNVIDKFCNDNELVTGFNKYNSEVRFIIKNPFDLIQRQLIFKDFFEIDELEFIKKKIQKNARILEVGANIGNHIVYYSKFISYKKVIAVEPNPEAITILKKNLVLNKIENVDILQLGAGAAKGSYRLEYMPNNLGATQLIEDSTGNIQVARLDDIIKEHIDFIKIDVENMEMDVLDGARQLIELEKPRILIEVMNDNFDKFHALISELGYSVTKTFKNVYASNFFIEPDLN